MNNQKFNLKLDALFQKYRKELETDSEGCLTNPAEKANIFTDEKYNQYVYEIIELFAEDYYEYLLDKYKESI